MHAFYISNNTTATINTTSTTTSDIKLIPSSELKPTINAKMLHILISACCFILFCAPSCLCKKATVTYGSSIILEHLDSKYRLFSAGISWGSGSGQQAVTAVKDDDNSNGQLWIIKDKQDAPVNHGAGVPVLCGSSIRLQHLTSNKHLHSHFIKSPISGKYEVSAYGENGSGNTDDNFIVECLDKSNGKEWTLEDSVAFRHIGLNSYMQANRHILFTRENCPRCPILGHLEVVVNNYLDSEPSETEVWKAHEGVIISTHDDDDEDSHDEL